MRDGDPLSREKIVRVIAEGIRALGEEALIRLYVTAGVRDRSGSGQSFSPLFFALFEPLPRLPEELYERGGACAPRTESPRVHIFNGPPCCRAGRPTQRRFAHKHLVRIVFADKITVPGPLGPRILEAASGVEQDHPFFAGNPALEEEPLEGRQSGATLRTGIDSLKRS